MPALVFAAFSLISVPAYVAMFSPKEELEMDEEEAAEKTYATPSLNTEEWKAATAHKSTPISGLFQRARLKRLM